MGRDFVCWGAGLLVLRATDFGLGSFGVSQGSGGFGLRAGLENEGGFGLTGFRV